jgi:hypothetical protein
MRLSIFALNYEFFAAGTVVALVGGEWVIIGVPVVAPVGGGWVIFGVKFVAPVRGRWVLL